MIKPGKWRFVPNEEIRQELTIAVESKAWSEMLGFGKNQKIYWMLH
mgnify:CR=1 FL=1